MKEQEVDKHYMTRATEFIDLIFDKGYFNDEVKREDLRKLDEYLGFLLQSTAECAVTCNNMVRKIKERGNQDD